MYMLAYLGNITVVTCVKLSTCSTACALSIVCQLIVCRLVVGYPADRVSDIIVQSVGRRAIPCNVVV